MHRLEKYEMFKAKEDKLRLYKVELKTKEKY